MAAVSTFQALAFVLIGSSLVAASNSWCSRYSVTSSCDNGYVCCNSQCIHGTSCVNRYCTIDTDCWSGETCCNNKCKYGSDCIGYSCSLDADCKWNKGESCCHDTCIHDYDECYYAPVAVIVSSVFGGLVFIVLVSVLIFYLCRRHQRINRSRRFVRMQGQVVTGSTAPQGNPPYLGQVPPSYQQGYPFPSSQYGQYQTVVPPPYNPGTDNSSK